MSEDAPLTPFRASQMQQEQFADRVLRRQTARMELAQNPALLHIAGAGLAFALAILLYMRGATGLALGPLTAGAWHAAFAFLRERAHARRESLQGPSDLGACALVDGQLRLRLDDGEEVLWQSAADGKERSTLRLVGSFAQMIWGIMMAGLPAAIFAGATGPMGTVVSALGVFVGAGLFGRGFRGLVGVRPVQDVVVTNQRVALLRGPGAAHSIPHQMLRYRPVVIARADGRASLGLEARPLPASRPLSALGLYGLHDIELDDAKRIAQAVVDARA